MYLAVDFREHWFFNELDNKKTTYVNDFVTLQLPEFKNVTFNIKKKTLDVGDFVIYSEDNDIPMLMIERKTIQDLSASIVDGRFREQKQRISNSINIPSKIVYLIEDDNKKTNLPKSTISSAILNLMFKHNFKVIYTKNQSESFNILMSLYYKIMNKDFDVVNNNVAPIKLVSKKNSIQSNIFPLQLSVIPGVSYTTACCIRNYYPTMNDLITTYHDKPTETERELMLAQLILTDKRKVGRALSKKIYHFLFDNI